MGVRILLRRKLSCYYEYVFAESKMGSYCSTVGRGKEVEVEVGKRGEGGEER